MPLNFTVLLGLIAVGMLVRHFLGLSRWLNIGPSHHNGKVVIDHYRPMLRLLSDDDSNLVSANKSLSKEFRGRRVRIFREYLRCLTKDYGQLLAGLRMVMVQSDVDRPDLARTLALSKMRFIMTLYQIDLRLFAYQAGLGTVDVSGLVAKLDGLRIQATFSAPRFGQAR